jgi:hypothetical protein
MWHSMADSGLDWSNVSSEQQRLADAGVFLRQSKLGLSYPFIVALYKEASTQFTHLRRSAIVSTEMHFVTRALMLVNADNYSVHNVRRQLLVAGVLSLQSEVKLLDLVFTKHPKSGESWSQR